MSPVAAFRAIFKSLMPDHRVIAYDRTGYGASDPAQVDLNLQLDDLGGRARGRRARTMLLPTVHGDRAAAAASLPGGGQLLLGQAGKKDPECWWSSWLGNP